MSLEYQMLKNKQTELQEVCREFLSYLEVEEESDLGNRFHPVYISCCRAAMMADIGKCLNRMDKLC